MESFVPVEIIEKKILLIRGQKVMLDADLAELYGISTKVLKQAVKRNNKRFPADFMFVLTYQEVRNLRSQFVTSSLSSWGGVRYSPMAFTEQGVAMLSSVLHSERAIEVNILIMRAFVKLREMIASNKDLARRLDELEKKYDEQFRVVFEAIRQLMASPAKPKRKIGFLLKEKQAGYGKIKGKSGHGGK
ncbi:MAG: ORF6N domain-containing protein [Thermodesulfobacteriota bacterium]